MEQIKISVRNLVEFILRSGDIDNRYGRAGQKEAMRENGFCLSVRSAPKNRIKTRTLSTHDRGAGRWCDRRGGESDS